MTYSGENKPRNEWRTELYHITNAVLYRSIAVTPNNASEYRANGLGLGVRYSPLGLTGYIGPPTLDR